MRFEESVAISASAGTVHLVDDNDALPTPYRCHWAISTPPPRNSRRHRKRQVWMTYFRKRWRPILGLVHRAVWRMEPSLLREPACVTWQPQSRDGYSVLI